MRIVVALIACLLTFGCGGPARPLESADDGTVKCTFTVEQIKNVCLTNYGKTNRRDVAAERHQAFYDAVNGAKEIPMGMRLSFEARTAVLFTLADGREILFYGGNEGGRQWGVSWRDGKLNMMVDSAALGAARRGK